MISDYPGNEELCSPGFTKPCIVHTTVTQTIKLRGGLAAKICKLWWPGAALLYEGGGSTRIMAEYSLDIDGLMFYGSFGQNCLDSYFR